MKCPRCKTENQSRSVCSQCGKFLYSADYRNGKKLTEKELRDRDRRTAFNFFKKIGKGVWLILAIIVTSFWLFLLMYFVLTK